MYFDNQRFHPLHLPPPAARHLGIRELEGTMICCQSILYGNLPINGRCF